MKDSGTLARAASVPGPATPPPLRHHDLLGGRGMDGFVVRSFPLLSISQCNFVRIQLQKLPGHGYRPAIRAFLVLPSGREDRGGPREASCQRVLKSLPPPRVALRRRPGRGPTPPARSPRGSRLRHFLPASWRGLASPRKRKLPWPSNGNKSGGEQRGTPGTHGAGRAARGRRRAQRDQKLAEGGAPGSGAGRAAGPDAARSRHGARPGAGACRAGRCWKERLSWERRPSWRAAFPGPATGSPPRRRRKPGQRGCPGAARMLGLGRRRGPRPGLLGRRCPGRPACRCTTP